jgi:hypothetical protein
MGNQGSDSATLNFAFATTSTTRNWEIKVTQVECSNPGRYTSHITSLSLLFIILELSDQPQEFIFLNVEYKL